MSTRLLLRLHPQQRGGGGAGDGDRECGPHEAEEQKLRNREKEETSITTDGYHCRSQPSSSGVLRCLGGSPG